MKDAFKGFYNIDKTVLEELWKDEKTLFVFDANVLLNLYGYAKQTRDDFFSILQAVNDKLWIPYHVGLEYQRRRLSVIRNEKVVFNDIDQCLEKIQSVFKGDFEKLALKRRFPKLFDNTEKLEKEISKSISNYKKSVQHWDNEQPCVRSHDEIRERLNNFFNGKVGEKPEDQKWLDELYEEGKERFTKKIPPGFKDSGKGSSEEDKHFYNDGLYYERQYGDLILWKQLIIESKNDNIENVIFVTDDAKEDWWYQIKSNGKKTVGPLAELQSEIYRESNIRNFHMYSTSTFLEDGKSNLSVDVSESSIEDASTPHMTESSNSLTPRQVVEIKNTIDSTSIDNERLRKILGLKYDVPSFDNEQFKEILGRQYDVPSFDDERFKEILGRKYDLPSFDDERFKEILGRKYDLPSLDDERFNEILDRKYDVPTIDHKRIKSVLDAASQKERDRVIKAVSSLLVRKGGNDESDSR